MGHLVDAGAPYQTAEDPRERLLGYVDFRVSLLKGAPAEFSCVLGTMTQEVFQTHPAIRAACEAHIAEHAAVVAKDVAEAKRRYVADAAWSPDSLAMFMQATVQGAFVLAKAKGGADVAVECLLHLRRYLESAFPERKREIE